MADLLGIGSVLSGVGGLLGSRGNKGAKAAEARNLAYQKEFAKNQIQWRVQDAQKAGLHPLYALGASSQGFSPFLGGSQSPSGSFAGDAMQAIGSAMGKYGARKEAEELRMLTKEKVRAEIGEIRARQGYVNQQAHKLALDMQPGRQAAHATSAVLGAAGLGYLRGGSGAAAHTQVEPFRRQPETGTSYKFFGIPIEAQGGHTPTQFVEDYYGDLAGAVHGTPRYIYDLGRSAHKWYRGKLKGAWKYGQRLGRQWRK